MSEVSFNERFGGRFLDRGGEKINAHHPEFGVVGDGRADDTERLQAALDAAGTGGRVFFRGRPRIRDTLVLKENFLEMVGAGAHKATGRNTPNGLLGDLGVRGKPLIHAAAANHRLSDFTIVGSGKEAGEVALESETTIDMDRMEFIGWGTAVRHGTSDYSTWRAVTMRYTEYGIVASGTRINNFTLDSCQFRNVEYGLDAGGIPVLNLKVIGGSYEGYRRCFRYSGDASFFGTFFETSPFPDHAVVAIQPASGGSVNCFGIFADLTDHRRFFNFSGLEQVHATILATRAWFDADRSSTADPVFIQAPTSAAHFEVRGTRWDVTGGNPTFITRSYPRDNFHVEVPGGAETFLPRTPVWPTRTSPPPDPVAGIYVADGTRWDPAGRGSGPYPVWFDGERFTPLLG